MASRPQPEQQAPPVQRLRVRYAKRGRARFASHRDFGRAFERALRRAGIPMAYSSGFSPHPRISYANASPTGAASEAEYLEIGLSAPCDPTKVRDALDAALPPGLDIVEVVMSPPGALADLLTGSRWRVDLEVVAGLDLDDLVRQFLATASVTVQRMTKNGLRDFDARGAVVTLAVLEPTRSGEDARDGRPQGLTMTLAHQVPLVRPDDVLVALAVVSPGFAPVGAPLLTRLSQGVLDLETGMITEPG